jgi:uncharacterized protein
MKEIDMSNKGIALITGAASGIGRVYSDRLAQRAFGLILVDRQTKALSDTAEALRDQYGVPVETMVADLTNSAELEKVASLLANDERITMFVNNAGTSKVGPLIDASWAGLEEMIQVNVLAHARLALAVLPAFVRRNQGTIINMGSVASFCSVAGTTLYSGTKAFVLNFTRGLQNECLGTNVVVQLVAPAATVSGIWEVAGVALSSVDPEQVMSTEHCVDAALAGLDAGEAMTLPSLHDITVLEDYEAAAAKLLDVSQVRQPAARYGV